jgi:hypothetical protein
LFWPAQSGPPVFRVNLPGVIRAGLLEPTGDARLRQGAKFW